jgi:hypothetical protein
MKLLIYRETIHCQAKTRLHLFHLLIEKLKFVKKTMSILLHLKFMQRIEVVKLLIEIKLLQRTSQMGILVQI